MKEIPLTKGYVALVDDEAYEFLSQWSWCAIETPSGHTYAQRTASVDGQKKGVLMHRLLMDAPKAMWVDHINRNSLDNRRENLRLVTPRQNQMNLLRPTSSGFKGVYFDKSMKRRKRWSAQCDQVKIGRFHTAEEAARAYDEFAKVRYGEYAYLNFPESA